MRSLLPWRQAELAPDITGALKSKSGCRDAGQGIDRRNGHPGRSGLLAILRLNLPRAGQRSTAPDFIAGPHNRTARVIWPQAIFEPLLHHHHHLRDRRRRFGRPSSFLCRPRALVAARVHKSDVVRELHDNVVRPFLPEFPKLSLFCLTNASFCRDHHAHRSEPRVNRRPDRLQSHSRAWNWRLERPLL